MLSFDALKDYLKTYDVASYCGLAAVSKMWGDAIGPYAEDIFKFLNYRKVDNAFEEFVHRTAQLRVLQTQFEKTGRYPTASHLEVQSIDDEQYKLALLLSFVSTSHRFDILQALVKFLRLPCDGPKEILSIGYGTGYELKIVFDEIPGWKIEAYDTSPESRRYATDLLSCFGYPADCLRQELFDFGSPEFLANHRERFGKVLLCELLEHLDDPELALRSVRGVVHAQGHLFCTMAVNIAQEDHVYLCRSVEEARAQVVRCGFEIVSESLAPVVILPFPEEKRAQLFKKGNYLCVAKPK